VKATSVSKIAEALDVIRRNKREMHLLISRAANGRGFANGDCQRARESLLRIELGLLLIEETFDEESRKSGPRSSK